MAHWTLAARAREDFADMMEGLSEEQLASPSLCEGWDAKGVLSHLVMFVELGAFGFFATIAKHRFDFDKAWLAEAADRHRRPTAGLITTLRDKAGSTAPLPGFPEALTVADVAIHTQDARRPLDLEGELDPDVLRDSLEFLTSHKQAKQLVDLPSLDGVKLVATDIGWTHGEGAEVSGTGEALMMALARRPVLDELDGPGVDRLR